MPEPTTVEKLQKNLHDIMEKLEPRIKELEEGQKGAAEDKEIVAKMSEDNAGFVDQLKAIQEAAQTASEDMDALKEDLTKRLAQVGNSQSAAFKTAGLSLYEMMKADDQENPAPFKNLSRKQGSGLFEFERWGLDQKSRLNIPLIVPPTAGQTKAITNASGSAGDTVDYMRVPGIIGPGERALIVRDLIPSGTTQSDTVRFVRETALTDAAAPQAGQGVDKGESDFDFTAATATVQTIAHYVVIATQLLDDAVGLQSYIDGRMRYLLLLEEEDQLLNGDGTGQNLSGINTQATAYDSSLEATLGLSSPTDIDILRVAMYQVVASEYPPTGIVLNPLDWAGIELTKDSQGRYIFSNPQAAAQPRMWGLPCAVSLSQPAGEFTVGSFALGAQIWDRMSAAIAISTEDSDNFRKNLATMRAELREALTVYRTLAFVNGPFAGSGS